jgi:S-adenosylmethionine:tRNA ribosyltransferase-isomerase
VSGLKVLIPTPDGDLLRCELIRGAAESDHGTVQIRFDRDPLTSGAGLLPLPPYIERAPNSDDDRRYQTLHAEKDGSVAAPTAGLHFTPQIRESLRKRGVDWETLTLHVGMGTFRPVKCSDIRQHPMHKERTSISPETAGRLTAAKARGRKIVAVGTTSVRVLESAWDPQKAQFLSGENRTQLFIFPGGPSGFRVVDQMITNFHLPRSTLLMMVTAFAGRELIREAYAQAVKERYRFFSYGDAMVIL